VVIDDFDISRSSRFPFEADSKLAIDPNADWPLRPPLSASSRLPGSARRS
jgi:hypothetical protein